MKRRDVLRAAAAGLSGLLASRPAPASTRKGILIGTGAAGGVYFPLGGALCRLFNLDSDRLGMRCSAETSPGSVTNIEALRDGEIDVGIVQSDVLADAIRGEGAFAAAGPMSNLRLVLAAHDEPFTIVARTDVGIVSSADLAGKRVNIGNVGSGHRVMMERLMRASGLTRAHFAATLELGPGAQVQALCQGRIDAIVYSVGHPNGLIQEAVRSCGGRLVPIVEERIREIVASHSEYESMSIPGGVYRENWADTPTFGTRAMVVTTTEVSAPAIRHLVQSVIENADEFRQLHLAFARLDPRRLAMRPDFATFHSGAEGYLRERGLLR